MRPQGTLRFTRLPTSPEPHVLRNCVGIGINDAGDHEALGQLETDELAHEIVLFLAQRAADQPLAGGAHRRVQVFHAALALAVRKQQI